MRKIISLLIIIMGIIPSFSILLVTQTTGTPQITIEVINISDEDTDYNFQEGVVFVVGVSDEKIIDKEEIVALTTIAQEHSFSGLAPENYNPSELVILYRDGDKVYRITIVIAAIGGKLDGTDILNNTKRYKIYNYILNNPGSHLRQIIKEHGFSPNQASYHLATLERHGLIVSYEDGRYKQYYGASKNNGSYDKELVKMLKNENILGIIRIIFSSPEISMSEIRDITQLHRNTVSKLIRQLKIDGIIEEKPHLSLTPKGYAALYDFDLNKNGYEI